MADPDAQLFVQLYSKLAAALSLAGTVRQDPSSILSLQVPGLYIRPHLDTKDPTTQYYVANALNAILACSWTAERKAGTISDVYKAILDCKETPLAGLSPKQHKALDDARTYLLDADDEPTTAYRQYLDCQLAYLEALDNYEAAAATQENGGLPIPLPLVLKLKAAEIAWRDRGNKAEVESAIATVAQYEALEPATFWQHLAERYARYTLTAGINSEFQLTTANPPYEQWFEEFGWSDFQFDSKDFANQDPSGGAGIGDRQCCCCTSAPMPKPQTVRRAFSVLDSVSGDTAIESGIHDFRLSCRLRRIEIGRPWMDTNVFYSRAWRWFSGSVSFGVTISTGGDIAGRVLPSGVMPVLPVTAILARDVDIYWSDDKTMQAIAACVQQGGDIHFGPFRLSRGTIRDQHHITSSAPQLIGFISAILPKCPNPDPTLQWPLYDAKGDEWF